MASGGESNMKILSVVGARPNFMKVAPVIAAINAHNNRLAAATAGALTPTHPDSIRHVLVHTGQHYDQLMSDSFFTDLDLPKPDVHLGVGSGSHAIQTADVMRRFEDVLLRERPDVLVVVGDVNSTVACALVAAKVSFDDRGTRPLIAHIEAGLRSFDRTMPEEVNRVVTDHLSDFLFVTEESGLRNLASEGIAAGKIHFVGNTMIDSLMAYREKAESSSILDDLRFVSDVSTDGSCRAVNPYALLTLHRPANVDRREPFLNILVGLDDLTKEWPVVFPAHPRTQKRIGEFGLDRYFEPTNGGLGSDGSGTAQRSHAIRMIEPLGYLDFLCLMKNATLVVTDSGGIQEETTCLGVPCVTVRANTERPVTIELGTNLLGGVDSEGIRHAIQRQLTSNGPCRIPPKWDGHASERIIEALLKSRRRPFQARPDEQPVAGLG
jgi:UDP-N-acetylglucosamine 2-epimerase (non-hydrolysing)